MQQKADHGTLNMQPVARKDVEKFMQETQPNNGAKYR